MTLRKWLTADYPDIVGLINDVMSEFKASGSKERRNWWIVLAGGDNGEALKVAGREFPVLRAARIRQGKPVTPNAICRNLNEVPPGVTATKRWPQRRLPSNASRAGMPKVEALGRRRKAS